LDSSAGVSEEVARSIGSIELGQGMCGTVAERRQPTVLNHVQDSQDPKAELIRSLGLGAYACFPLLAGERLIGTLSFGSRRRQEFSPEEVEMLQTVGYYLAVAQEQAWHRRNLERAVEERTADLREMISELEHMSYGIMHNMRAPLRALEGFAALIGAREAETLQPESREMLSKLRASAAQMDQLINDVLSYSKAVRGKLPLGVVDVGRVMRELQEENPAFRPPQAEVLVDGEFPPVLANAAGLSRCLAELLRNGVKFVAPGKRPLLKVRAERVPHPGDHVRVWVEDHGLGVPQDAQGRIFNLFERLCGPEYPGTGVGLAMVRKLMEQMKGEVGVDSEPGQGSRFWLELQAAAG
jgi:signal transduction histidine kinase